MALLLLGWLASQGLAKAADIRDAVATLLLLVGVGKRGRMATQAQGGSEGCGTSGSTLPRMSPAQAVTGHVCKIELRSAASGLFGCFPRATTQTSQFHRKQ